MESLNLNNNYLKQQNEQLLNEINTVKSKFNQPATLTISTSREL